MRAFARATATSGQTQKHDDGKSQRLRTTRGLRKQVAIRESRIASNLANGFKLDRWLKKDLRANRLCNRSGSEAPWLRAFLFPLLQSPLRDLEP